jgi:hypothetical protein
MLLYRKMNRFPQIRAVHSFPRYHSGKILEKREKKEKDYAISSLSGFATYIFLFLHGFAL